METKIKWSEKSALHLQNIYNYIAEDSEIYAYRFVNQLILSVEAQLSVFPLSGRNIPEFEGTYIYYLKEVIYKGYRIIYNPEKQPKTLTILAIINCKMSFDKNINPEWVVE